MQIAHVVGLGKSGLAAARLLKGQGWEVTLHDRSCTPALVEQRDALAPEGIGVNLGQPYAPIVAEQKPSLIVVSPGVPWDLAGLVAAREQGIDVIGEMALAGRSLKDFPWVGITGTNGKTTTTALIAAIFQRAGLRAPACGNIGYAACELALEVHQGKSIDWVVAEFSSYQIEAARELAPRIALWTTFTPDHLERHKTIENYFDIKARLLRHSPCQILNGDDPMLRQKAIAEFPQAQWTSVGGRSQIPANPENAVYLEDGWVWHQHRKILPLDTLKMRGNHNHQNLLLATAAALQAGIEPEAIAEGVSTFPGVSHRLECVATYQGVDFINDSKATNYDAAAVGLAAMEAPVILIAGGSAKAGDDRGWLEQIQAKVARVLLIGDAAPAFAQRFEAVGSIPFERVETMEKAIQRSLDLIPQLQPRVVLLSPACASFDQYANFEQRGDHFREICRDLGKGNEEWLR